MVRAKVVAHPGDWPFSGYHELQQPRERFRNQLVDWRTLLSLLGMTDLQRLREARAEWVEQECRSRTPERDPKWTESVAVGGKEFVEGLVKRLGAKGIGRYLTNDGREEGNYILKEEEEAYLRFLGGQK
jgi:putative transposase